MKDKAKLQGVHNYDILANDLYAQKYLYTPVRFPNRYRFAISEYGDKELRKASLDLVRIVCDFPYLDKQRALDMEFSEEYVYLERLRQDAIEKGLFKKFAKENIHFTPAQEAIVAERRAKA